MDNSILNDLIDCRVIMVKPYNTLSAEIITLKNDETGVEYSIFCGQTDQRGDPSIYVRKLVNDENLIRSKR